MSGIAALEKLTTGRKLIYSLYPRLAEISKSDADLLSMEGTRLIILAPQVIAGAEYLTRLLPNVTLCTFQALKVNDEIVVDYTEPPDAKPGQPFTRKLGEGTFGLQAHDPDSVVRYRNIRVKRLE